MSAAATSTVESERLVGAITESVALLLEQPEDERLAVGLLACPDCGLVMLQRRKHCLNCGAQDDPLFGLGPEQEWGD